jgi:hypothetical protein
MRDGVAEPVHDDGDVLLERDAEIAELAQLLSRAIDGAGSGLLVRGPAGIGKTALLLSTEALAASRGMRVLTARGAPFERQYPFGVIRQLLDPVLGDVSLRSAVLTGAATTASSVFDTEDAGAGPPDTSFAATYGLFWALQNLGTLSPVLLSVDDLHWIDEASLRVLDFVLRRVDRAPIALIAGLRSGEELSTEQVGVVEELEAAGLLRVLEPKPLSSAASGGRCASNLRHRRRYAVCRCLPHPYGRQPTVPVRVDARARR